MCVGVHVCIYVQAHVHEDGPVCLPACLPVYLSVCLYVLSRYRVIRQTGDMSFTPNWDITLCLLLAWVLCYFCIWKGIKSTGKVSCPEPVPYLFSACAYTYNHILYLNVCVCLYRYIAR